MTDRPFFENTAPCRIHPLCGAIFCLRGVAPHWFVFLAIVQNRLFCPKNKTFSLVKNRPD